MRPTRVLVVGAFLMGVALPYVFAATTTKKAPAPVKKGAVTKAPVAASKSSPKKAVATKSAAASKGAPVRTATAASSRKRVASRSYAKTGRRVAAPVYRGQQGPSSDRYQEIQQALIEKGYLQGTPSGTWDTQTSDAMRRFQTEKNLPATGHLNSLSLIQLGLGPKRLAMVKPPSPSVPSTQPAGDR